MPDKQRPLPKLSRFGRILDFDHIFRDDFQNSFGSRIFDVRSIFSSKDSSGGGALMSSQTCFMLFLMKTQTHYCMHALHISCGCFQHEESASHPSVPCMDDTSCFGRILDFDHIFGDDFQNGIGPHIFDIRSIFSSTEALGVEHEGPPGIV